MSFLPLPPGHGGEGFQSFLDISQHCQSSKQYQGKFLKSGKFTPRACECRVGTADRNYPANRSEGPVNRGSGFSVRAFKMHAVWPKLGIKSTCLSLVACCSVSLKLPFARMSQECILQIYSQLSSGSAWASVEPGSGCPNQGACASAPKGPDPDLKYIQVCV